MMNLNSKSISQLRKIAVSIGSDKSSIRSMSKKALIDHINRIHTDWRNRPENQAMLKKVAAYVAENYRPSK